jgi:hypothetical protein
MNMVEVGDRGKEEVSNTFIGAAPFLDTLSVAPLSLKVLSAIEKQLPAIVPAFPDKTKS